MKNILLELIKGKMATWDRTDIYAVSLYVYDMNDNPCEPVVILGYNTVEQFQKEISNASGSQEAKWNYAFWLQNEELSFGVGETQSVVKQWIESEGYSYFTYEEMFEAEEEPDESLYEGITESFIEVLIEVVKELHESGFIKEQFSKEIPVLILELEYYEEIAEQNLKANPAETVKEFVKFCYEW
ncbi:MAG: DUF4303 domain-containing protein [Lachnospiraceae bacterium]|nr:DUF4303 domain-containing protein [Lachnospiraceae bacterium]